MLTQKSAKAIKKFGPHGSYAERNILYGNVPSIRNQATINVDS